MEIERKFLVKKEDLPKNLEQYPKKVIEQGYLCTDPVVRIRQSNDSYYLTYKSRGLLAREEYNLPLTREAYEHLIFKAPYEGMFLAEVEFPSEEAAKAYQPPEWFGEDVTYSAEYHNSTLSKGKK